MFVIDKGIRVRVVWGLDGMLDLEDLGSDGHDEIRLPKVRVGECWKGKLLSHGWIIG